MANGTWCRAALVGLGVCSIVGVGLFVSSSVPAGAVDTPLAAPKNKTLFLNFTQADIRDVLQAIAIQQGVNIVPDRDVSGPVDVYLKDVPLETALNLILATNGFTSEKISGVYRVSRLTENPLIRYANGQLTVHANNVDLRELLARISKATGLNFVTSQAVEARITTYLNNVQAEAAVFKMLTDNGFRVEKQADIFRVSPALPPYKIEYGGGKISVQATDVDIRELLHAIGRQTGNNIVVDNNVGGKVTVTLTEVDFLTGMQSFLSTFNLAMVRSRNIYRIYNRGEGVRQPIVLSEGKVTMDVDNAELQTILDELATQGEMNLVTYGRLSDRVNARYDHVAFDVALKQLLASTNYDYTFNNNTLIIGSTDIRQKESKFFTKEKTFHLKHVKSEKFLSLLPSNLPSGNFRLLTDLNSVVVSGTEEILKQAEAAIADIDRPVPQIEVEVLVMELNRDKSRELGLASLTGQRKKFSGSHSPGGTALTLTYSDVGTLAAGFTTTLQALEQEGAVKVLARPKVMTESKKTAKINVGSQEFFRVTTPSENANVPISKLESIPSGISLSITPWMGQESDAVHVEVLAEVSSASRQASASELPTISTRRAQTEATLLAGQTMILGGMINARSNTAQDRTPWLHKVPWVGNLFKKTVDSESSSELVFYITPRLVTLSDTVVTPKG